MNLQQYVEEEKFTDGKCGLIRKGPTNLDDRICYTHQKMKDKLSYFRFSMDFYNDFYLILLN